MSIPFIHQTDLYHPHGDPDDHYDLATVFALAQNQRLDLTGVMIDYPPPHRVGGPGVQAVTQMSFLTGVTGAPVVIGAPQGLRSRTDRQEDLPASRLGAVDWLVRALRQAAQPVILNIVGGCTDVALAGLREPELFAEKVRAIYLNAGSAYAGEDGQLEYNVRLNPAAYAAVFDLPCPIYWCPCWHRTEQRVVGEHGTWYAFAQRAVFEGLSERLVNFFLYMLSRSSEPKYLRYLEGPVDADLLAEFGAKTRQMWSTAGILHAAELSVTPEGEVQPLAVGGEKLFSFEPITVRCSDAGETEWALSKAEGEGAAQRYLFTAHQPEAYAAAMTAALRQVLSIIDCEEGGGKGLL